MSTNPDDGPSYRPPEGTTRMEGFSDAYFAVVITLLVLELHAPELPAEAAEFLLWRELLDVWPTFVAFGISFVNLLVFWVTHHELMRIVTRIHTRFLYLNGALLFGITVTPFATALVAEHILGPAARLAATLYCAVFLWIAIFFNLIWRDVGGADRNSLVDTVTPKDRRRISRTYSFTLGLYAAAFILSFFVPLASIGLTLVLAFFFAVVDRLSGFASEDLARDD